MKRPCIGCLVSLVVIIGLGFGALWLRGWWLDQDHKIAEIECGEGRHFLLIGSNFADPIQDVCYQVIDDGMQLLRHHHVVGYVDPDISDRSLRFQAIVAPGGGLAGLIEETQPTKILAIYDFQTGETWPSNWDTPHDEHRSNGERLVERLSSAVGRQYELYSDDPLLGSTE